MMMKKFFSFITKSSRANRKTFEMGIANLLKPVQHQKLVVSLLV